MKHQPNKTIPLGIQVDHKETYHPAHLFPVPRKEARTGLGLEKALPFTGTDIWNAYELSWLDAKGKPRVAIGELFFPCTSDNIVESKSLKLYFNALNQTRFDSREQVGACIKKDLSNCVGGDVQVSLFSPDEAPCFCIENPKGTCLDHLDITVADYNVRPDHLKTESARVKETLYSNLLRTNCPVTRQPDWATVFISYSGPAVDREGLLKYLISYRCHTGFHENCVETIFMDILTRCRPDTLTVSARFTRRGGIDINPFRTNSNATPVNARLVRQ